MSRETIASPTATRQRRPAFSVDLAGRFSGSWRSVVVVYLASRLFSTSVLFAVYEIAKLAGATFITPGSDRSFLDFTSSWDADRYRTIALHGYPSTLPTGATGEVLPNEWAFLPVFPYLCHLLMVATGMDFIVAAPLLATVFGAGAAIVLHRLLVTKVGHTGALWAVLLFCFGPMAFVMSVGYAESLFLLLMFGGLLAMQRRQYPLVAAAGIVASFVRPGALALALALGIHLIVRWHTERERPAGRSTVAAAAAAPTAAAPTVAAPTVAGSPSTGDAGTRRIAGIGTAPPALALAARTSARRAWAGLREFVVGGRMPTREVTTIVVAGLAMAAAGLAWPVVAHVVTGQSDAYLETEMAWWVDYVGRPAFVPLTPWFLLAGRWLGIGGIVLVLAIVASFTFWMTRRSTLRLGHEVVAFVAGFFAYLVAVFLPQQSLFRLLMPLSPVLGTPAISSRPWLRRTMLLGGAALQPVAVVFVFLFTAP
ncbi:mannosyltransferase family protein [Frigoribacterium sp. PhB24]|uniref:mannosyltransferase family protein n=1 Tax=Frigoribacterium sp. PhB24 TaxID=2485204 RepID=UPI000F48161F|nr:mannosyltransferase family protein [Frigoribacterium sp. PhB24]ROS52714.1 mannosyltransferase PIG-V [Frigoribacterium sp. PhB24]